MLKLLENKNSILLTSAIVLVSSSAAFAITTPVAQLSIAAGAFFMVGLVVFGMWLHACISDISARECCECCDCEKDNPEADDKADEDL